MTKTKRRGYPPAAIIAGGCHDHGPLLEHWREEGRQAFVRIVWLLGRLGQ